MVFNDSTIILNYFPMVFAVWGLSLGLLYLFIILHSIVAVHLRDSNQGMFAVITPALITGGFVDRMRFGHPTT